MIIHGNSVVLENVFFIVWEILEILLATDFLPFGFDAMKQFDLFERYVVSYCGGSRPPQSCEDPSKKSLYTLKVIRDSWISSIV